MVIKIPLAGLTKGAKLGGSVGSFYKSAAETAHRIYYSCFLYTNMGNSGSHSEHRESSRRLPPTSGFFGRDRMTEVD